MADVKFKRLDTANRILEAVEDGKYILDYQRPSIYLDEGTTRIELTPRDTALSTTSTNPIENQALTNSIINTLAEALAITADYIPCGTKPVKELNTIVSNLITAITPVVLWTNPAPTTSFGAQTITLSETIANFSYYEIEYIYSTTVQQHMNNGKIGSTFSTVLRNNQEFNYYRAVSAPSATSLTFGVGVKVTTYGSSTLAENTALIPFRVIGYK